MGLEQEIRCLVSAIVAKRRDLDAILNSNCEDVMDERAKELESELHDLNRDADRARRWLSSCGVVV